MASLIALGAALAFGIAHILVRTGLNYGSSVTAITVNIVSMTGAAWLILAPWGSWQLVTPGSVGWFMVAGAIAPLITQFLFYASILRVGVARAAPLRNTTPLFASVLAVIFLGEQWSLALAGGTVMIIAGATLLGSRGAGGIQTFRRSDLLLPIGAAILGGIVSPMRKFGFSLLPSLPLAVCFTLTGSLVGLFVCLLIGRNYEGVVANRRTILWFGLSGLATAIGLSSYLLALQLGQVVVVDPLVATAPLFTLLFAHLFLRAHETVTLKITGGTALICVGVIVIILF